MLKRMINLLKPNKDQGMLKKLVKYGNSNALILDKPILELLNIEEGAVVKIKTDGNSIIITPQTVVETQKISETYTHDDASRDVMVNNYLTQMYADINESQRSNIAKKLKEIIIPLGKINYELMKNPQFTKELKNVLSQHTPLTPEYNKAYEELKIKNSQAYAEYSKKLRDLEYKYNLSLKPEYQISSKTIDSQKLKISQELSDIYTKVSALYEKQSVLLDNPDYQHELQLIAERYNDNHNSIEYLDAQRDITSKYYPEINQLKEELKSIIEKYPKVNEQ